MQSPFFLIAASSGLTQFSFSSINWTTLRKSFQRFNISTGRGAKLDKSVELSVCPFSFSPQLPDSKLYVKRNAESENSGGIVSDSELCAALPATTQMEVPFYLCRKEFHCLKRSLRAATLTKQTNGLCRGRESTPIPSARKTYLRERRPGIEVGCRLRLKSFCPGWNRKRERGSKSNT